MNAPHWIETGRGERALVFLHGISGGAAGALDILPLLTPPGWRGLAWDMPGYGKSRQVEPVNFDSLAGALVDLFDAAGLEQAFLRRDDALGAATPLSAIASARHETQYSRLFRS